ncbi:MAG: hypothetical protein AAB289_07790 [Chloroflexota bacterium]|mgnify:CR=1 FL=1
MLDPAYGLVWLCVAGAIGFWAVLLGWAIRTGHFTTQGESVKYRVFEDETVDVRRP